MGTTRFAIVANQAFALLNFRGPLMRALVARGVSVVALAPDFSEADRARLRDMGVEPVGYSLARTGLNPLRDLLDTLRLWTVLRRLRLDGQLAVTIKPVIYGTIAAWLARVPRRYALVTGLGYAFSEGRQTWRQRLVGALARRLYRFAFRRATGVFVQNRDDEADLIAAGVLKGSAAGVFPTGVDLSEWTSTSTPSQAPLTFLLAARLVREKGIYEFVGAAEEISRTHPDIRFVVLGGVDANPSGITATDLEGWVKQGLIEWPGHVDVRPWLDTASAFVLPSYYREGVPRSIQEAMAMGRPIITTDTPGCRDTVEPGKNGVLIQPRSVPALVAAMRSFIHAPDRLGPMGRESRRMAEERFDADRINSALLAAMGL